jgi:hypothetical protein
MLIGICGREGAGKTTAANYICFDAANDSVNTDHKINDVQNYITEIIFGMCDGKEKEDAKCALQNLFKKYLDPNFEYPESALLSEICSHEENISWSQYSFADPLKKITSLIFGFDHIMLQGTTEENRKLRETMQTEKSYSVCGPLTGRQALEYMGTDVFRKGFDKDIWIKIFKRNMMQAIQMGRNIVIPDVRFANEARAIDEMGGTLITIYRDPEDLILTENDRQTHPAKWTFLTFDNMVPPLQTPIEKIHNNGSIEELCEKISHQLTSIRMILVKKLS